MISSRKRNSLIPVRIGALMVSAGLIKPDVMQQSLLSARRSGKKLGELLVSEGAISSHWLKAALEVQALIKDGSICVEVGARVLKLAHELNKPISTIMTELGCDPKDQTQSVQDLSTLLLEAGIVTKGQVDQAKWNSAKNCMPLGRNLVLAGAITPSMLRCALNAMMLFKNKAINFKSAIRGLKLAAEAHTTVEDVLDLPVTASNLKLGELLSSAGLLSESDAMTAVENGMVCSVPVGQILLESSMISPLVLDATLKLQQLIGEGSVSQTQATELLRQVASKQIGLEHFLSEMSNLKTRVLDLLLASGLVAEPQLLSALAHNPDCENDILSALSADNILTRDMFRAIVRCIYSIEDGSYTEELAIEWLRYTYGDECTVEETALSA
jgi:hypothetical protein